MNLKKLSIPIQTKLMPTFYREFACIMGRCQENCCDCGWNIWFSKKDYLKIKRAPKSPAVEERVKKAMRRLPEQTRTTEQYAEFVTREGKCPLHNEDGLCELQLECGRETLPLVCRTFPRKEVLTPMAKEYSLSTACEAVVEQLWNLPDGIEFLEEPLEREQWRYVEPTSYNRFFPILRSTCIDILQNRRYSIPERLVLLGVVLDHLQTTGIDSVHPESWVQQVQCLLDGANIYLPFDSQKSQISLQNYLDTAKRSLGHIPYFQQLIFLLTANITLSKKDANTVQVDSKSYYTYLKKQFEDAFGDISYFWENLLVNTWFYLSSPDLTAADALWKSYVNLCQIYSFFRHTAVLGCGTEPTREKLFHAIVMASREMLHNSKRQSALRDHFFEHDSATLAHMAILVQD